MRPIEIAVPFPVEGAGPLLTAIALFSKVHDRRLGRLLCRKHEIHNAEAVGGYNSGPFGHSGKFTTIREAITPGHNGEATVCAVCSNPARTDLCGGRSGNQRPYRDKTNFGVSHSFITEVFKPLER